MSGGSKLNVSGAMAGGLGGVAMWIVMMVVTTGVCSVPILSTLWCTALPFLGPSTYVSIALWDMFLLVTLIIIGVSTGATRR